jgi:hypothetical protein
MASIVSVEILPPVLRDDLETALLLAQDLACQVAEGAALVEQLEAARARVQRQLAAVCAYLRDRVEHESFAFRRVESFAAIGH